MNYATYLQLDQLLSLQKPVSPPSEHRNENLFIITHQTYELWFKQLIEEIHQVISLIEEGNISSSIETMKRINTITQTIVNQISVIFTLKFHEFQNFRGYLSSASGFQSYQFAGIEMLLGKSNSRKLQQYKNDSEVHQKLMAIIRSASLWDTLRYHLMLFSSQSNQPTENYTEIIRQTMKRSCNESLLLYQLLDLDSLLQEWRYRHVMLVERTIGQNKGTGGSSGSDYLKSTLFTPFFDELWEAINEASFITTKQQALEYDGAMVS